MTLDVARIRKDFPILAREVHGSRLVYLDSANTSQKPQSVLDAMTEYYERSNANVHRGTYLIAQEALTNVAKHAQAGRVEVDLTVERGALVVRVEDDGQGMPPQPASPVSRHAYGLLGMRERALQLRGQLLVQSSDGGGTRVVATLPWDREVVRGDADEG